MPKDLLRLRVTRARDVDPESGVLVPCDGLTQRTMRELGYSLGSEQFVEPKNPRSPGHMRLVHVLGNMLAENVDRFEGMDAHSAIKALQAESGVECDTMKVVRDGEEMLVLVPRSISFSAMSQGRFDKLFDSICDHAARTYWAGLDRATVERMADLMS